MDCGPWLIASVWTLLLLGPILLVAFLWVPVRASAFLVLLLGPILGGLCWCLPAVRRVVNAPDSGQLPVLLLSGLLVWPGPLLLGINGALDFSEGQVHRLEILESRVYKGRLELTVHSWKPGEDTLWLYPRGLSQEVMPGDIVEVVVRPGALGWEWLESVVLVSP